MRIKKTHLLTLLIIVCILAGLLPVNPSRAASGPATPVIKAVATSTGTGIKLTIKKTSGAQGYYIYLKKSHEDSFKKVKTLKKDGSATRSVTFKELETDLYTFKVKAYTVVDGKKQTSAYSEEASVKLNSLAMLINVTIPDNNFNYEGKSYPKKSSATTVGVSVDKSLSEAYLRLEYVDLSGEARPRDIGSKIVINSAKLSFYITGEDGADLAVMAYATKSDANNQVNPLATSEPFHVEYRRDGYSSGNNDPAFTDPDDNQGNASDFTEPEEPKYADITFKNGKVYFGEFPQNKVTDRTLIAALDKLQAANPGSQAQLYKGKYYQLATVRHVDAWYEASPVEWIILEGDADSDTVTLMANVCLLCTGFTDYSGYSSGAGWKDSFLRNHLNGYDKKFNSIWSYDLHGILFGNQRDRTLLDQKYGKCVDQVMLPTKEQVEKLSTKARTIKASDMTTVAGEYGYWLMDSAGSGKQYIVTASGKISTTETWRQEYGVVPVIRVSLKNCNIIKQ